MLEWCAPMGAGSYGRSEGVTGLASIVRGGVRLVYDDLGAGPPVFFHTGAGGDASMWRAAGYLDALPVHRYVLFDHRGHGRSDTPRRKDQHGLQEYLADVVAVLDALDIARTAFVGYSDGAHLGFALAAQHPERVSALVAIGAAVRSDDDLSLRTHSAEDIRWHGVRTRIDAVMAAETEPAPAWLVEKLCATPAEMFALELEGWADSPSASSTFARIAAPTLIVCGEREDPDRATELAAAALPDGKAVTLPGLGHLQVFWRADLTAPIIADFLRQQHC